MISMEAFIGNTYIQLPVNDVAVINAPTVNVDKVKLWDGSDIVAVNGDGSINTKDGIARSIEFAEISGVVASGSYSTILTKVVVTGTILYSYEATGDNVAEYQVTLNGNAIDHRWSYWTNFNVSGQFGMGLSSGDTVQVKVRHQRPSNGSFSAKLILGN
jgi:hypothetical protein